MLFIETFDKARAEGKAFTHPDVGLALFEKEGFICYECDGLIDSVPSVRFIHDDLWKVVDMPDLSKSIVRII